MSDRIAPEMAAVEVVDTDGNTHRLGEYWADRPVVLLFVRHFG
jgi:hypothetical protein